MKRMVSSGEDELQGLFIRMTPEQHQILKEKSTKNDVSMSSLIRLALWEFLDSHGKKQ